MTFGLALEALTAVLLVATIVACMALHRRVATLRQAQIEMAQAIEGFNAAAARAEAGIQTLRQAAEATAKSLQEEIERGRAMAEDLAVAIRAGDRLASRLTRNPSPTEARRG